MILTKKMNILESETRNQDVLFQKAKTRLNEHYIQRDLQVWILSIFIINETPNIGFPR